MRYIIYTRVSTNKQTVENQLHVCREYVYKIKEKGDEVIEFSEPDKSTMKPMKQRKKLIAMLNTIRKGDQLIVYKVDRLARDKQELINIYCDIRKMGVSIIGLRDPSLNEESICIYAFVACTERKNTQERTKDGLNRKRANGEKVGTTWYGYKVDETKLQETRKEAHSYGKPYLLLPEEEEQKQVNLMIKMHELGASYGEIALLLASKGFRNRKGNPVHKSTVYRVLKRLGIQNQAPTDSAYA
jgi:DNA invertase Pin-like site-specific DNA recombinase